MSSTTKNMYYTVSLDDDDDDLESQDYLQEKKAPWFSVPVRSAAVSVSAPSRPSPLSALKQKLCSWSNNDNHHHNNTRSVHGGRGFWDRWIWLAHAVLLTISITLFALSLCTLQTAAATAVQCQGQGPSDGVDGSSGASIFGKMFCLILPLPTSVC